MAKAKTVTYECRKCGTEVVVTSIGTGELSPLYCCGIEVAEIATTEGKTARQKKKSEKKNSRARSAEKKATSVRKKIRK